MHITSKNQAERDAAASLLIRFIEAGGEIISLSPIEKPLDGGFIDIPDPKELPDNWCFLRLNGKVSCVGDDEAMSEFVLRARLIKRDDPERVKLLPWFNQLVWTAKDIQQKTHIGDLRDWYERQHADELKADPTAFEAHYAAYLRRKILDWTTSWRKY
jgi:hypothetical protein